ncbi:sensor histidine kinase [Catenuloplanes japonicus]|uniref:sensor histidine kinase n=1 Tax=Catenuloplanes japonicus TaxID=33876 RepID=UPI00052680C3|nr:sensor histidine kinase [Catenuloplanes japonicus]
MHRVYAWLRRHPAVVTAAVAVPLGALSVPLAIDERGGAGVLVWPALAVMLGAMVLRHFRPTPAYLLVVAAGLAQIAANAAIVVYPVYLAVPLVLYSVAAYGPRWARISGLFWIVAAPALVLTRLITDPASTTVVPAGARAVVWLGVVGGVYAAPLAIAWIWGDATRSRQRWYQQLADRADRLERERQALDRAAVAEERARIARELHDVVAHHVSVIVVQADGARYSLATAPDLAREALDTISATGREALAELRGLLGVLRGPAGDADPAPQPGVDAIPALVSASTVPATLSVTGRERPVSASLGLTAYRVVQEALTNARKHGGPEATAAVALTWRRSLLVVEVTDTGGGPGVMGTGGHGIAGMRERAGAVGGTLTVGSGPDGGFRVRADLPLRQNEGDT